MKYQSYVFCVFVFETLHLPFIYPHPLGVASQLHSGFDCCSDYITHSADSFPLQVPSHEMCPPEALNQQVLQAESSFFKSNSSDSHLLNAEIHNLIVTVVLSLKSPLWSKLSSIALFKENHLKSFQFNTSLQRRKRFICNNRKDSGK